MDDGGGLGREMHDLIRTLYPICRSITGNGVRTSLEIIGRAIPLKWTEVPSGTDVFDWRVPREWNIRDAYVKNLRGERVIDFRACNLHVLNYSTPVKRSMSIAELRDHLFAIPEHPSWIPYRTSYYTDAWGFCVTQQQLDALTEESYEVCIDSTLSEGSLTYAECCLPGMTTEEVLVSCHVCHPSLCNDNLSGISVAVFLARHLLSRERRLSYRFLFIPGTIGAIAWLALNRKEALSISHGLVLTCVGDGGAFHYKKSRRGNTEVDRAVAHVLRVRGAAHEILEFSPYGYDERQFCSPGFNLPVGCLMRSMWGQFPEYHTSADDLEFVTPKALQESFETCRAVLDVLEGNHTYQRSDPYCEPALGRRGLYRSSGRQPGVENLARLWVLNLADGAHSLLDIAERSGLSFSAIYEAAAELARHGLLVDHAPVPNARH